MSAVLIDGKEIAAQVRAEVAQAIQDENLQAHLAVLLVGEDPASQIYVRNKARACKNCGIGSTVLRMPAETTQEELHETIDKLNGDPSVHGILVQLPLPRHLDAEAALKRISPEKDVDGLHTMNAGHLFKGEDGVPSCTPAGCMELLRRYNVPLAGANAVVIGRSNIVGKPMAMMLLAANCTVTVCHSKTKNLAEVTRNADILVAAIGKSCFVTADMVKPGAAVIDVGMNRDEEGHLTGDVDFETVKDVAGYITPVPGGVGPMTIAMLMRNTLEAARHAAKA